MQHVSPKSDGFTLVELLVVISIITILAGLTISTMSFAQNNAARNRARAEITGLSVAIESYKIDNGDYPRDANTDGLDASTLPGMTTSAPSPYVLLSSVALYKALSGDTALLSGTTGVDSSGQKLKVYFPFKPNMLYPKVPAGTARTTATAVQAIVDPFKNVYGYSTIGSAVASGSAATSGTSGYNPTFDLWSTGGATSTSGTGVWLTNW